MLLIPRSLRRTLGRLLPEFIKAPWRGRLYGYRPARTPLHASIVQAGDRCLVTIDDTIVLHAPSSALADLAFHLRDNGESVDEIASLLQVARTPGGLLLDVGGHKSVLSHLFCLAAPNNRAISYEPSPSLRADAAAMRTTNGLDDRLILDAHAIGDRQGTTPGYVDSNGLIAFGAAPFASEAFPVEFTTIDAECARRGVTPHVVKIDIEGYEDQALAGAARLLAEHPPILLLEFHLDLLDERGIAARALLASLRGYGYSFHTTTGKSLSARDVYASPTAVIRFVARPPAARR
ncbi:MAG TPA: FkbM family methyltransferase [Gemmatimonadaceae bacterium]